MMLILSAKAAYVSMSIGVTKMVELAIAFLLFGLVTVNLCILIEKALGDI
jgi:hypothetical protein